MTTGEFEFDEIFRQSPNGDSDDESEIQFEVVSYILWIIFIVVMPILLTNMLVSLVVVNSVFMYVAIKENKWAWKIICSYK